MSHAVFLTSFQVISFINYAGTTADNFLNSESILSSWFTFPQIKSTKYFEEQLYYFTKTLQISSPLTLNPLVSGKKT